MSGSAGHQSVARLLVAIQVFLLVASFFAPVASLAAEPSDDPGATPSAEPSAEPTPEPTPEPTAEPTPEPTAEPTPEPAAEPAAEPTPEPTAEPTPEPAAEPAAEPTPEPTAEPTAAPTAPPAPTYAPSGPPSIRSDLADYPPGATVTLTGSNWQAGEIVHIFVNDDFGSSWTRYVDVTAGADGQISDVFTLPDWFVAVYRVVATGASGGSATATFTDASLNVTRGPVGNPPNLTFTVTAQRGFATSACTTGGTTASYLINSDAGQNVTGLGGDPFVKLTAPNPPASPAGYTFKNWTAEGDAPTAGFPKTTLSICVRNTTGSLNDRYRANYELANTAPVLAAIGNKNVNELVALGFTATATDADVPANTLTFSLADGTAGDVPTGASITAGGVFSWTPTEAQGPGVYTFDVVVSDGSLTDFETIQVTVAEVNVAPVLAAIGNKNVNELVALGFTATATDADVPANTLTFSLADGTAGDVPTGASITAGGVFSWTPTEAQGPGVYTFDVVVSDGSLTDFETIQVTVAEVNVAPVLAAIGNKNVNELVALGFTATATDADVPANTLTFSLADGTAGDVPTGASITAGGVFSWTPTEAQGPGVYTFDVVVSDGSLTDFETIQVTVAEVNVAPVLAAIGNKSGDEGSLITFDAEATDADIPANVLTFSLADGTAGDVPTGASITAGGVFSWTPTEAQGPGVYTFDVVVSDGSLTDFETIQVTVAEVNVAPVLAAIGNKNVNELVALGFTATATDADVPANTLTFSLADGTAGDVPTGASITAGGVFSWTPTEAQGPGVYTFDVVVSDGSLTDFETIQVTVAEVNVAPVLAAIGNKNVNELVALGFTATATDADVPANTLTFSLADGTAGDVPTGASITAGGVFSWTPTEAQGPGVYTFDVVVSDGSLTDFETIQVTVAEVNVAPVLAAIGNKSGDEGSLITFDAEATDADIPANVLTFSLADGTTSCGTVTSCTVPVGATINSSTGEFDWTPPDNGTFRFKVVVTDNGVPVLFDSEEITITVNNVAPTISLTGAASVDEGSVYTLTLGAVVDPGTDTVSSYQVNWGDGSNTVILAADLPASREVTHTYADGPASRTITVDLTDEDDTFLAAGTKSITVNNVAPTISLTGAASVDEGSVYTLTLGAVVDPGTDTVSSYQVNWGDGSNTVILAADLPASREVTHTYADGPASRTITVDLTDEDDTFLAAGTKSITVNNVAPTISLTGAASVDEGSVYTLTLGAVVDPGTDTVSSYQVNWGDGSNTVILAADLPASREVTHTYADGPASRTITVDLTDEDDTFLAAGTKSITVNNVAPTATFNNNGPVAEGSAIEISLTDPADASSVDEAAGFTYAFDCGSGYGAFSSDNTASCPTDDNGIRTVKGKIRDKDLDAREYTAFVTITNVDPAPTINGAPASSPEGTAISLTSSVSDPGTADTFTYAWSVTKNGSPYGSAGTLSTYSFTPNDNGTYVVTLVVTDDDGGSGTTSKTITVTNVDPAPTINGAPASSPEGTAISLTSSVSDPGTADTFTYAWSVTKNGSPYGSAGTLSTYSFTPNDNGTYVVTLVVTDDDGGSGTTSKTITVTNVDPAPTINGAPASSPEGTAISLTSSVSDPGTADTFTYAWSVTKNGSPYGSAGTLSTYSFTPNDNGTYVVTLVVTDDDGGSGTTSKTITVTNVDPAPTINGAPASSPEGTAISLTSSVSDPGTADTFTYAWSVTKNGSPYGSAGTLSTYSFTPNDNGTYVVTLVVTDDDGGSGTTSKTITVTNVAPTITNFTGTTTFSGPLVVAPTVFTVTFTDPGTADTWTAVFTYGDGSTQTVSPYVSGQPVSHTYTSAVCGRIVSVVITDDDGGSDTETTTVNVGTAGFQAPMTNQPVTNKLKNGQVLPVKVFFKDCTGAGVNNLTPAIRLVEGDLTSVPDDSGVTITPPSVSGADTDGFMRSSGPDGSYMYNMRVNVAKLNTDYTVIIYPNAVGADLNSAQTLRHVIQATK